MSNQFHLSHCCVQHGCKYGDDSCPVTFGPLVQEYPCESCTDEPHFEFFSVTHFRRPSALVVPELEEVVFYEGKYFVPYELFATLTERYDVMTYRDSTSGQLRLQVDDKGLRFKQR